MFVCLLFFLDLLLPGPRVSEKAILVHRDPVDFFSLLREECPDQAASGVLTTDLRNVRRIFSPRIAGINISSSFFSIISTLSTPIHFVFFSCSFVWLVAFFSLSFSGYYYCCSFGCTVIVLFSHLIPLLFLSLTPLWCVKPKATNNETSR